MLVNFSVAGTSVGSGRTDAAGLAYLDWTITSGAATAAFARLGARLFLHYHRTIDGHGSALYRARLVVPERT